jgi:hypothetical protein
LEALQVAWVNDVVALTAVGCVTFTLAVAVHPLASVTTQEYAPAARLLAVAALPPEGLHAYVKAPVPPEAETVAVPLVPPKHDTGVNVAVTVIAVGCVTATVAEVVQPLASVTVTDHVPAVRPVTAAVPSPVGLPGDQLNVLPPAPPVVETEAVPVAPPLHNTGVATAVEVNAGG